MNGIIYKATNSINGKSYIGLTTGTLNNRKKRHEYDARHTPNTRNVFHRALNKHGKEIFKWSVIDTFVGLDEGKKKEVECIQSHYALVNEGYNVILGYNKFDAPETELDKSIGKLERNGFFFGNGYDEYRGRKITARYNNGKLEYKVPCSTDDDDERNKEIGYEFGYMWIEEGCYDTYGKRRPQT